MLYRRRYTKCFIAQNSYTNLHIKQKGTSPWTAYVTVPLAVCPEDGCQWKELRISAALPVLQPPCVHGLFIHQFHKSETEKRANRQVSACWSRHQHISIQIAKSDRLARHICTSQLYRIAYEGYNAPRTDICAYYIILQCKSVELFVTNVRYNYSLQYVVVVVVVVAHKGQRQAKKK